MQSSGQIQCPSLAGLAKAFFFSAPRGVHSTRPLAQIACVGPSPGPSWRALATALEAALEAVLARFRSSSSSCFPSAREAVLSGDCQASPVAGIRVGDHAAISSLRSAVRLLDDEGIVGVDRLSEVGAAAALACIDACLGRANGGGVREQQ